PGARLVIPSTRDLRIFNSLLKSNRNDRSKSLYMTASTSTLFSHNARIPLYEPSNEFKTPTTFPLVNEASCSLVKILRSSINSNPNTDTHNANVANPDKPTYSSLLDAVLTPGNAISTILRRSP